MSLKNQSEIDMISGPEFINLQPSDINPLMSKCEIKVFYLGKNRNGSYIDKETAENMSKTLRGTPIVAAWRKDIEDYGDHGSVIHIEDGEVSFSCKTVPYGFVGTDAEVWFQNFVDTDEFDNKIERTYLMTTGYLWTGQFEELDKVVREGQPHSMELDGESMKGHWAEDSSSGYEFFIINDAIFSKLCILGDDVEPCYQGSSVTVPKEETEFSLAEDNYSNTFFALMEKFTNALQNKGGSDMDDETLENEPLVADETEESASEAEVTEEEAAASETEEEVEDDATADDDDAAGDSDGDSEFSLEQYQAIVGERDALAIERDKLLAENTELKQFKLNIENARKDELIAKYFMISDEDKASLIEHKSEFTYDEIEAKLALMYVEQNVNFSSIGAEELKEEEPVATTFSINTEETETVSPLLGALRRTKHQ